MKSQKKEEYSPKLGQKSFLKWHTAKEILKVNNTNNEKLLDKLFKQIAEGVPDFFSALMIYARNNYLVDWLVNKKLQHMMIMS